MIAGVVRDDTGSPVEGARVYFTEAPVSVPDIAAVTGPDGRFALGAPTEGTYTVECNADGYTGSQATVTVPDAPPLTLTVRPAYA